MKFSDLPLLSKEPDEIPREDWKDLYPQSKMAMNRCAIGLTTVMPETTFILTSPGMCRTNLTRYIAAEGWGSKLLGEI